MKTSGPLFVLFLGMAVALGAQNVVTPVAPPTPLAHRTATELEELLGPIALYPDALIALILPASTVPADVVLAARQMGGSNNDRSHVESRAWEDSVKSLSHYPEVLRWMDENLEWTKQLGEAFIADPAEVMNTIQRLRSRARAAGTLTDTPQQQVIASVDAIRIVPAQPNVIYVPTYEPSVVYVDRPVHHAFPPLSFGYGFPVGSWLAYDCDWVQRKVWVGDRHRRWHSGNDWHRPLVAPYSGRPGSASVRHWRPPAHVHHPVTVTRTVSRPRVVSPSHFGRRGSNSHFESPAGAPSPNTGNPPNTSARSFRPESRRDIPGPHAPRQTVVTNRPLPVAPPLNRGSHFDSTRYAGPRGRSLPNTVGNSTLPVAPPLRMVVPPSRAAANMGPHPLANVAPALPSNIAPSLPNVAPSLPAVVPSLPDAPAFQPSPPPFRDAPPRRNFDRGDRRSRRGAANRKPGARWRTAGR